MKRPDELRTHLFDVQQACELVSQFTKGKSLEAYLGDVFLRSAVERRLQIIGEALGRAMRVDPSVAQAIPDTRRMMGFRNRLVHAYDSIADDIVWDIVEKYLPVLVRNIERLVAEGEW